MAEVYRDVRVTAAIIAGHSAEMDAAAERGLRIAKRIAAAHRLTGQYMSNLKVVTVPGELGTGRLVSDRLIVADDPGAASIEWGHVARSKDGESVTHVPGQKILTRTREAM